MEERNRDKLWFFSAENLKGLEIRIFLSITVSCKEWAEVSCNTTVGASAQQPCDVPAGDARLVCGVAAPETANVMIFALKVGTPYDVQTHRYTRIDDGHHDTYLSIETNRNQKIEKKSGLSKWTFEFNEGYKGVTWASITDIYRRWMMQTDGSFCWFSHTLFKVIETLTK